ncbi:MAG: alpha/beta fold hydrolase [Acidimicrobiales bacterium]
MDTVEDTDRPSQTWCRTPDGLEIAVYDFGGRGQDLLLVHATGFCAEVFTPLAQELGEHFQCWGLDLRAHGRSERPPEGNFAWSGFATDVLTVVDHLGLSSPAGFGHSCGGAALLLAEEARPGTFLSLYCFEPVVLPVPAGEEPPWFEDNPLTASARRRRDSFPTAEDAFVNFSSKPPLSDLDPEVLRRYVETGFEPVPAADGGDGRSIRLRCRREDEAMIYAHDASHGAFARLGEVGCPVALACGERTDAFGLSFLEADAARLRHATIEVLRDLGHFGPLQRPGLVSASVAEALKPVSDTPSP